jgi:hypothetical protein
MLKALDREEFDVCVKMQNALSKEKRWHRHVDPFGDWADIDGCHTEEHADTSDCVGGLAHFNASGKFKGHTLSSFSSH